ncbi:MAG: HAMP domain-containing protein [Nitrospiraceae bacterium]|nr:MAG: HAMP domain-containing protein [Nitrospiraceae bacterium]
MSFFRALGEGQLLGRIKNTFPRLNIAKKLLIGYLSLSLLLVGISVFSLSVLKRLNRINETVLHTDVPVVDATDKMVETLLAQELYARRYAILKSPDMLELFWQRSEEFNKLLVTVENLPDLQNVPLNRLNTLHDTYNDVFLKGINNLDTTSTTFPNTFDEEVKQIQGKLINLVKGISLDARQHQRDMTRLTSDISATAIRVTTLLSTLGILLGLGAALLITRNISGSIHQLKHATEQISKGKFDVTPEVKTRDELGELSGSFGEMARRLKRLEEMYLDANPLTKFPGGVTIQNILKKRIGAKGPLAFCLIDMDNFKTFNDRYGYVRGSELVLATARIIKNVVEGSGTEEDFFGHIGGDDFVIITVPERFRELCDKIISQFDKEIPKHYDEEDKKRGYIIGKSRQGTVMEFPIITLSIAVVTNEKKALINHIQVGELAAELKEYAKSMPGSRYVVDQRRDEIREKEEKPKVMRFPQS